MRERFISFTEYWTESPKRWLDVLGALATLAGIVGFVIWTRSLEPPLPWWNVGIITGGVLLLQIASFEAFNRVRMQRDEARASTPNIEYADRKIIDSKVPKVLEITDTLQKMADYQNIILNKLLNKTVKMVTLAKMQAALRNKLNMELKDSKLGNSVKIDLIQKEMKRLGIYTKDFNEGLIPILVEVTWTLNNFNVGMPQYLAGC